MPKLSCGATDIENPAKLWNTATKVFQMKYICSKFEISVQNDPSSEAVDSRLHWDASFELLLQLELLYAEEIISWQTTKQQKEDERTRTDIQLNERTNEQKRKTYNVQGRTDAGGWTEAELERTRTIEDGQKEDDRQTDLDLVKT